MATGLPIIAFSLSLQRELLTSFAVLGVRLCDLTNLSVLAVCQWPPRGVGPIAPSRLLNWADNADKTDERYGKENPQMIDKTDKADKSLSSLAPELRVESHNDGGPSPCALVLEEPDPVVLLKKLQTRLYKFRACQVAPLPPVEFADGNAVLDLPLFYSGGQCVRCCQLGADEACKYPPGMGFQIVNETMGLEGRFE